MPLLFLLAGHHSWSLAYFCLSLLTLPSTSSSIFFEQGPSSIIFHPSPCHTSHSSHSTGHQPPVSTPLRFCHLRPSSHPLSSPQPPFTMAFVRHSHASRKHITNIPAANAFAQGLPSLLKVIVLNLFLLQTKSINSL